MLLQPTSCRHRRRRRRSCRDFFAAAAASQAHVVIRKTGEAIFLTHRLVVSASSTRPADQDELDRRDARAATCVPPTDVCRDRDQLRSCDETRPSPKHRRRRRLARPGGRIRPCSRRLRRRRLATKTPSLLRIGTSPTRRSRASNEFTISEKITLRTIATEYPLLSLIWGLV